MTFIHCGDEKPQEIKLGKKVGVTQCGSLRPSCGLSRVKITLFPGSCLHTQGPILDHGDDALASRGFPGVASGKASACPQGRRKETWVRSLEEPLQCSCLENPVDRGAWQATVHGSQRVRHH